MNIEKAKLEDLVSPEWNPRQITDEELTKLQVSLDEFGYIEPIIVNDVNNHIVGGNQRAKALKTLGYDEIDVVYVHIEDLAKEKACNVALNKISGDWDNDKLRVVLEEIELSPIDVSLTGFGEIELTEITEPTTETEPSNTYDIIEDNYQDEDITVTVQDGDLYQLGQHRLYCGDATKKESYTILCQDTQMELVFTDPPYGMKKEKDGIQNDNLNYDDLLEFNKKWIPLTFQSLKSNGSWYCWGIDQPLMDIYSNILKPMIKNEEITFRNLITWDKGNGQGQLNAEFQMYPIADEKCLFIMKSNQGYGLKSFKQIRDYLTDELNKTDLTTYKKINKVLGVGVNGGGMASHYFGKNIIQFVFPTEGMYSKLQNYCLDNNIHAFEREYEDLRREYEDLRAYFNNTHDNMNNVWHFHKTSQEERESTGGHATPKPLALCGRAILSSSRENENVLDVFGGSGSTLIACEQLNRNCYMMELDPYYCQVIINRWEQYTGMKATKIN